jgi:hypothetical protein
MLQATLSQHAGITIALQCSTIKLVKEIPRTVQVHVSSLTISTFQFFTVVRLWLESRFFRGEVTIPA